MRTVLLPGLAVGILSTALPYTLEMYALTRLPARTFGILMSIEPAFGALIGYVYLHEWLTAVQWTAIALVILASIGATASATGTASENRTRLFPSRAASARSKRTTAPRKMRYPKPVWNAKLRAEARVVKRGRTVGLVDCDVRDEKGDLVARATSTLMTLRGDQAKGR